MRWRSLRPSTWPVTTKAPMIVAVLMVGISAIVSQLVFDRMIKTQERHLEQLSGAYLDGLSSSILPYVLREDVWEVFDTLDRSRTQYSGLDAVETVVTNSQGKIIAASDPSQFSTSSEIAPDYRDAFKAEGTVYIEPERARANVSRKLSYQDRTVGWIYSRFDISELLNERRETLLALFTTNTALTVFLAAVGFIAVRRIVAPVRTLEDCLGRSLDGPVERVPGHLLGAPHSEFGKLFRRYNLLVNAVNEREALAERLAREEKLASLGRLTSGMAHEINNPLGGMFNAIDALKRHGQRTNVRTTSLRLLENGLVGIRDVVRAALATYRRADGRRSLKRSDLEDLRLLIRPELRRKSISLDWVNHLSAGLEYPMAAAGVRQIVLNLLLNACATVPEGGRVGFAAKAGDGLIDIMVSDDGAGLSPVYCDCLESEKAPVAPLGDGSGLGIWMIRRLADEMGGHITVLLPTTGGTQINVVVPVSEREGIHAA